MRLGVTRQTAWDGHDACYLYKKTSENAAKALLFGGAFVARLASR